MHDTDINKLLKGVKSIQGLIALTVATCFASNLTMPEQYIAIVVPGRMYAKAYKDMNLHPKTLSNALESAGTLTSPLVPWNTCGVFLYSVLGVNTMMYAKWAIFNYLTPLVVIALSFVGVTYAYITDDKDTVIEAKEA